jgi:hypothetical protein
MAPKENIPLTTRTLRLIPVFAFIFVFITAIPYATEFHHIVPLFGLFPYLISVALSFKVLGAASYLRRTLCCCFGEDPEQQYYIHIGDDDGQPTKPLPVKSTLLILMDGFMAILHLLIFSMTIVEIANGGYYYYSGHGDVLGTFISMAYLVTGFSHAGLMIVGVKEALADSRRKLTRCPHCQKSLCGKADSAPQFGATSGQTGSPSMTPAPNTILEV